VATMVLKKLLFNRVHSDIGFDLKLRVFRGFVEYQERDHICRVPVEPVVGKPLVRVYRNAVFTWNEPYKTEEIPLQKRTEIIDHVVEGLSFRNCKVEVFDD